MTHARPWNGALRAGVAASLAAALLTTCVETPPLTGAPPAAGTAVAAGAATSVTVEGEGSGPAPLASSEVAVPAPPGHAVQPAPADAAVTPPPAPAALPAPGAPLPPPPVEPEPTPGDARALPPPPPPELPPVTPLEPRIRLTGRAAEEAEAIAQARQVPGVRFATGLRVGEVALQGEAGPQPLAVAAVDPADFRVLTPPVTAEATAVWQRVLEGDAAFTHDAGRRFAVELGEQVPAAAGTTLRVGAYASNGVPPVADAVVSDATADALGLAGREDVLVAVAADADPQQVADALRAATGLDAQLLEQPTTQRAFLTGADAKEAFEPYTYVDNGDGMIQIDPAWVERNIVRARVPILTGEVVCHRLMIDQLRGALQEIADAGLAHLIDTSDYGGCWVPRHIDFNPSKPLSMHSWGLAADFNVSTNGLGRTPTMDPRIVEIFERWGFVWGGRWRRPDGMHFELGALLTPGEG